MAKEGVQTEMQVIFHPTHEIYAPRAAKITVQRPGAGGYSERPDGRTLR